MKRVKRIIAFLIFMYFILSAIAFSFRESYHAVNTIFVLFIVLLRCLIGIAFLFYATGAVGKKIN